MSREGAMATITAAAVLDVTCGVVFAAVEHLPAATGLYWAVATATTVGYGDVIPRTPAGHVIAVVVMLTVVPLFAATFALFTAGLGAGHVRRAEQRIKDHVEERLHHHLGAGKG